jgi:hypothetical protein
MKPVSQLRLMKDGRLVLITENGGRFWSSTPIEPPCGGSLIPARVSGKDAASTSLSLWSEVFIADARFGQYPRMTAFASPVRVSDKVSSGKQTCYWAMKYDPTYKTIVANSQHQVCALDGNVVDANWRWDRTARNENPLLFQRISVEGQLILRAIQTMITVSYWIKR